MVSYLENMIDELLLRGYPGSESEEFKAAMRQVDLLEEVLKIERAAQKKIHETSTHETLS